MKLDCGANDPWYLRRSVRTLIHNEYKQAVTDTFLDALFKHLGFCYEELKEDQDFIEGMKEFDSVD